MGGFISQRELAGVLLLNRQRVPVNDDRSRRGNAHDPCERASSGTERRRDRQGALTMKLSFGPRQLTITLSPSNANGAARAERLLRGVETDEDFAKLANRNLRELDRARSEVSGFFSGSRRG